MKKTLLTLIALVAVGMTFSTAQAYSALSDAPNNAEGVKNILESKDALNNAILRRRAWNYRRHTARNGEVKSITSMKTRHNALLKRAGVNQQSTRLKRTGELLSVPTYSGRRATSGVAVDSIGNSKNIMRNRVVDYYVEGGDAGSEYLRSTGVRASEHRVSFSALISRMLWRSGQSDIVGNRNDNLRKLDSWKRTPTNSKNGNKYHRARSKAGYYYKNYNNPYQNFEGME